MDIPKSLKNEAEKERRFSKIHEKHMIQLTDFVKLLRCKKGENFPIPYFDPLDGGVDAKYLFLLEAPGPNAVKSGFISRNNPDESAKNIFEILQTLEIPRKHTVLWNIVPWYIGEKGKIRPANNDDISQGWIYFKGLILLLPKLDAIILVGRKAQKVKNRLNNEYPNMKIITCFHPSPMFINRNKENKSLIIEQLKVLKDAKKEQS